MAGITEDQYRVLDAVRGATALRREPGPLTKDGIERWHSLAALAAEGRFGPVRAALYETARTAGHLVRLGALARRTLHCTVYYSLTETGREALETVDRESGMTRHVLARLALDQARADRDRADAAEAAALAELATLEQTWPALSAGEMVYASRGYVRW